LTKTSSKSYLQHALRYQEEPVSILKCKVSFHKAVTTVKCFNNCNVVKALTSVI